MLSHRPRRARPALALMLAALVALPSSLALAGSAAKKPKGPAWNTPFVSADHTLRIKVVDVRATRKKKKHTEVRVRWANLTAHCAGGAIAHTLLVTTAPLRGNSFKSSLPTDAQGGVKHVQGRFAGKRVTGEAHVSFTIAGQGKCDTGKQRFTATSH